MRYVRVITLAGNTELGKPGLVDIKQQQDTFISRSEGTGVLPVICVMTCVTTEVVHNNKR
jgi:uncharacterized circularly permuted ATP-grasp superfamily protein